MQLNCSACVHINRSHESCGCPPPIACLSLSLLNDAELHVCHVSVCVCSQSHNYSMSFYCAAAVRCKLFALFIQKYVTSFIYNSFFNRVSHLSSLPSGLYTTGFQESVTTSSGITTLCVNLLVFESTAVLSCRAL